MPTLGVHQATLYYQVHGEGLPLVLAHGFGGNTLTWYQQVPHFAQRYRVINFDHRHWGRSECDPKDLDLKHFAGDPLALLDAENAERAAIVAHDIGGISGLRLALEHPERVSCLVLSNTMGGVMTDEIREALDRISIDYSRRGAAPEQALPAEFIERNPAKAFLLLQIFGLNPTVDPLLVGDVIEARVWSEELTGYSTPTLVIGGTQDWISPSSALRAAAALIPGADMVEFPEAGHFPHFEIPDEFNRVVGEFVARHHTA
jgi:pimeloyl-ACP methyl ester carboxylesterase